MKKTKLKVVTSKSKKKVAEKKIKFDDLTKILCEDLIKQVQLHQEENMWAMVGVLTSSTTDDLRESVCFDYLHPEIVEYIEAYDKQEASKK